MGQYHVPVSVEKAEGFEPHKVGAGLKAGEQLYTPYSVAAALVALVSLRGGNMPADLSQSPIVGRWAGTHVLMQGSYAADDDIPGWNGPRLSELYGAVGFENDPPTLAKVMEQMANSTVNGAPPGTRAHRREVEKSFKRDLDSWEEFQREHPNHLAFAEISTEVQALLEGACSLRFFGNGWMHSVRVKSKATAFAGVAEYELAPGYSNEDMAFFQRLGLQPIDYMRGPRSKDWSGLSDNEIGQGETRVLLNLDTMEYLDPIKFGEVPTIGGMMLGEFGGTACAMQAMLFHPERRGGGDLPASTEDFAEMGQPDDGPVQSPSNRGKFGEPITGVVGRWRGGRIIGTREFSSPGEFPSTEEAKKRGVDVSELAQKYLAAI